MRDKQTPKDVCGEATFLTDFRKTVETGVNPRLCRIAGLEERTSRWVVMEQLTFMRIFGQHYIDFLPRSFSESCSFW